MKSATITTDTTPNKREFPEDSENGGIVTQNKNFLIINDMYMDLGSLVVVHLND